MAFPSISTHKMNKYGDEGQPCLTPLVRLHTLSSIYDSTWCKNRERVRDQTMGQVVTYKRLNKMENYKTVSPKVVVVLYERFKLTVL